MSLIYMAPLEGITTYIYRNTVHRFFSDPDKYFTPYLSPADGTHLLTAIEMDEVLPENNPGITIVPQLMVNRSDLTLRSIRLFAEMDIREVNLNLGCPSGNVTRKRKGSGMLTDPDALASFLDEIYRSSPLPVSLKTRIGMHDPREYEKLLPVFEQFPIHELILHPRVRDEFYSGPLHREAYESTLERLTCPVIANGEHWTAEDMDKTLRSFPALSGIMLGRGLIRRPDLLEAFPASDSCMEEFYRTLEEEYRRILPGEYPVLVKLKRIWALRQDVYDACREDRLAVLQSTSLEDFHCGIRRILEQTHQ